MKKLIYIFTILIPSIGWCQNNPDTLEFNPLTFIEKISDNEIKSLVRADSLSNKDFFFTEQYKNDFGLFLVKKENENWSVYDFETKNYGSNTIIKGIKYKNNRFVSIQVFRFPSGTCASTYGIIILLDLINNEWTEFYNYNQFECYNENAEVSSSSECEVKFSIKDNLLMMKSSKKSDDGLYCFESGIYKYENRKFVKTE